MSEISTKKTVATNQMCHSFWEIKSYSYRPWPWLPCSTWGARKGWHHHSPCVTEAGGRGSTSSHGADRAFVLSFDPCGTCCSCRWLGHCQKVWSDWRPKCHCLLKECKNFQKKLKQTNKQIPGLQMNSSGNENNRMKGGGLRGCPSGYNAVQWRD